MINIILHFFFLIMIIGSINNVSIAIMFCVAFV